MANKIKKGILIVLCAGVLMALFFGGMALYEQMGTPGGSSNMDPDGKLLLQDMPDGSVELSWPAAAQCDGYRLELLRGEQILLTQVSAINRLTLDSLPGTEAVTIRISTVNTVDGELLFGDVSLEVTAVFAKPKVTQLHWSTEPGTGIVTVNFSLENGDVGLMYTQQNVGQTDKAQQLESTGMQLSFGPNGTYPALSRKETAVFCFGAVRATQQYIHYGVTDEQISIKGEDLLSTQLQLQYTDEGENIYLLTWNDVCADEYELRYKLEEDEAWETLCVLSATSERSVVTPVLKRFSNYQFQILARGEKTLEGSEYSATPDEIQITTGASAVYCTVWPQRDLEIYTDTDKTAVLGIAQEATAYCVLGVENGWFGIRYGSQYGYIDSNYCMINLYEYLGDLCSYDIANSYASMYMVHGFEIPGITGKVTLGYEHVLLTDPPKKEDEDPEKDTSQTGDSTQTTEPVEEESVTVTEDAAQSSDATGHTEETTESTAETTQEGTEQTVGLSAGTGGTVVLLSDKKTEDSDPEKEKEEEEEEPEVIYLVPLLYPSARKLEKAAQEAISRGYRLKIYDAYRPQKATGNLYDTAVQYADTLLPETTFDGKTAGYQGQTYRQLMTNNGQFGIDSFLAPGGSRHNQGLALDLTLETLDGKELKMQTAIHDLSRFAVTWGNNWNARILKEIMTGAGFAPLMTEWWHFQDDDARKELQIDTYTWEGVTPECWMMDENGWRYRDQDGQYLISCMAVIDGAQFYFDEFGYVI